MRRDSVTRTPIGNRIWVVAAAAGLKFLESFQSLLTRHRRLALPVEMALLELATGTAPTRIISSEF